MKFDESVEIASVPPLFAISKDRDKALDATTSASSALDAGNLSGSLGRDDGNSAGPRFWDRAPKANRVTPFALLIQCAPVNDERHFERVRGP